jgi:pilus assembly protein CpaB
MTVVVFALLLGLGGAFIVRQQLSLARTIEAAPYTPAPAAITVPVAAMDLETGQTVSLNEIGLLSFTPEKYQATPYIRQAYIRDATKATGRTLRKPMKKGDAFLPDAFFPDGLGPGIADRLRPGFRAVTVPIENVGAVQGFAGPGAMVDVLFRSRSEGERPEVTLTLLERVEVLALDRKAVPGQKPDAAGLTSGSVTLAVTPQQAKMLKVVEGRGELTLTLRNSDDEMELMPFDLGAADPLIGSRSVTTDSQPVALTTTRKEATETVTGVMSRISERVTLDDLLGVPPKPPVKQMAIFLGSQKTVVEFDQPSSATYRVLQRSNGMIRTPIALDDSAPHNGRATSSRRTVDDQSLRYIAN